MSSLIDWVYTQNDPWICGLLTVFMIWAYFSNDFCIIFHQIRWNIGFSVTQLQGIIWLQNFAHSMTAQLSCHVQNLIMITALQLEWEQNEISVESEIQWQNLSWSGLLGPISITLIMSQFNDKITHTQKLKTVKWIFCGVWVQNFIRNFKCALGNFTQNFEPIDHKTCILRGVKNFMTYDILVLWHLNSLRPSEAYMHQESNHHWFR